MTRFSKVALAALALPLGLIPQSPPRKWAGAAEYNLATESFHEPDPRRQVVLLRQWESQYPRSEFQRERMLAFAMAFRRLGQFNESFTRATDLLKSDPNDSQALLLVVVLGPSLSLPAPDQIAIVIDSASRLQSVKLALPVRAGPVMNRQRPVDEETQRVFTMIHELRRNHVETRPDPEVFKNQAIESALAWVKNLKAR